MRTHSEVIEAAGGAHQLAQLIAPILGADGEVVRKRVWAWVKADSIPGEYWALLARSGIAEVSELAEAAEARKLAEAATAKVAEMASAKGAAA